MSTSPRIQDIETLRAIAITLVFAQHIPYQAGNFNEQ